MAYIDILVEEQFEDYQDELREMMIEFKYSLEEINGGK